MQNSQEYKQLSENILNLENQILAVDVVSYNGDCLARATRREIKDLLGLDQEMTKRWATWTVLLVGLSRQFDDLLSEAEFLVIGRKNFKRLLVPLPRLDIVLSIILSKEADATQLFDLVKASVASDSNT